METAIEIAALVVGVAAFVLIAAASLRFGGRGGNKSARDDGFIPGNYHPDDDSGGDGDNGAA